MADNIIGIKFGVAGGKGFQAGSSGALIKEQLEYCLLYTSPSPRD